MLEILNEEVLEDMTTAATDQETHACDAFQVCGCFCAQQLMLVPASD